MPGGGRDAACSSDPAPAAPPQSAASHRWEPCLHLVPRSPQHPTFLCVRPACIADGAAERSLELTTLCSRLLVLDDPDA